MSTHRASLPRFLLVVFALAAACAFAGPEPGETAKLETVQLDGTPLSLDRLKGKVVMVNFWATWCPVCRAEMPGWQKFYDTNKSRGFELIAMSIDDDQADIKNHLKGKPFTFPVAWRWDDKTDDNFGDIIGTPTLFVVGKDGKVVWTKRGRVTAGDSPRSWSRCWPSNHPPAEPGAFVASRSKRLTRRRECGAVLLHHRLRSNPCRWLWHCTPSLASAGRGGGPGEGEVPCDCSPHPNLPPQAGEGAAHSSKCRTSTASPAEPGGLPVGLGGGRLPGWAAIE